MFQFMDVITLQLKISIILACLFVNGQWATAKVSKISQAEKCVTGLVENQVFTNFVLLNL